VTVGPEQEGKSSNSCNFERIMNIYMILLNINPIINFEGSSLHIGLNERHLRQKPQNCERWIHLDYMFISGTVSCDYSVFLKKTKMKCSKVSLHSNIKNQSCQLQLCYDLPFHLHPLELDTDYIQRTVWCSKNRRSTKVITQNVSIMMTCPCTGFSWHIVVWYM